MADQIPIDLDEIERALLVAALAFYLEQHLQPAGLADQGHAVEVLKLRLLMA